MIGRWMSLLRSSGYCTQLELDRKVKTSFDWLPPKEGCLMLNPSIMSWFVMMAFFSL